MDRGLLIALMALQSGFFTRQQFLIAFDVWLVNREQALDQILIKQDLLTGSQRERLSSRLLAIQSQLNGDWQSVVLENGTIGTVYSDMLTLAKKDKAALQMIKQIGEAMASYSIQIVPSLSATAVDSDESLDLHSTITADGSVDPYGTIPSFDPDHLP